MVECGRCVRIRVIPRQLGRRLQLHLFGVVRLGQRISEGVDPIEPAGVDEVREQVAGLGAKERLVAQWILAESKSVRGIRRSASDGWLRP